MTGDSEAGGGAWHLAELPETSKWEKMAGVTERIFCSSCFANARHGEMSMLTILQADGGANW